MTAEQQNRLRCRTIAAQLTTAFSSFDAEERATFILLRKALAAALKEDYDAEVAKILLQRDEASNAFPETKSALLALFDQPY